MTVELFRMENISKSFPGVKALQNVSFDVNVGEVHGLVGENGAGKSTLMKIISGVYQAEEGKIFINNKEVKINNVKQAQELGVSIIFQELNLCPHMTVADNIYIGRPQKRGFLIDDKALHANAKAILDDLGIDINTHKLVSELSVAQQQMVEIAKAISYNSRILVLDEPTAALTEKEIDHLFVIIKNLQKKGVGMVYISHRMDELEKICERVTVIRDGQYIGTRHLKDLTMDELVKMIVGRTLENKFPKFERNIGETRLVVKNLKSTKKRNINVEGFEVKAGEIVGVAGLMGSGRSEIARVIFGADKADSKEIYVDGELIKINSVRDAIRNGFAYATENRKYDGLALNLDVQYNINMANLENLSKYGFIDDKAGEEVAKHYWEALRIQTPGLQQHVRNLSGGNQQKIVLAKWICNNLKVLIVDEPTRGIDVGAKFEVYELFNKLSEQGVAIIMISSEIPEVLGMSDRILVVHEGEINGELVTKNATQEEILYLAAGYNKLDYKKNMSDKKIEGVHSV